MEKIYNDIEKKLVTEEEIKARVIELGKQITEDYNGEEVVIIGVLKGCTVFMSDLIRQIDLPVNIDFMVASSYGADTKTSGNVKIIKDINIDVLVMTPLARPFSIKSCCSSLPVKVLVHS